MGGGPEVQGVLELCSAMELPLHLVELPRPLAAGAVELLLHRTRPHGSAPVRRLQFRYPIYRIIGTPTNDPEGLPDAIPLIPIFL